MPLYEYQCDGKCGRRFEVIRKFSDPPLEKCPTCGGKVHKLQSSPAIQFKGSGFYITDYPKKDSGSGGKSESKASDSKASDSKETKTSTESSDKSSEKKSTDSTATTAPATKDKKK